MVERVWSRIAIRTQLGRGISLKKRECFFWWNKCRSKHSYW